MRIIFLFIIAFGVLGHPSNTYAQSAYEAGALNPESDRLYERLVAKAKNDPSYGDSFPFFDLRNHYARSGSFVSNSDGVMKELVRLTLIMENAADPTVLNKALREYKALIETHLGNIKVMHLALDQAIKNPRFGEARWIGWLYKGMVRSITLDRDGRSVRDAYRVISFDEESFLFEYLKLTKIKTKLVSAADGAFMYHRHVVHPKGKKTDRTFDLYVDVTYPLNLIK